MNYSFSDVISNEEEFRALMGFPGEGALRKEMTSLDHHCRELIGRSPFLLISSSNKEGRCDVSPRGDAPGFVMVLDDKTLLIPDRTGNRRADTLVNVLQNPRVGLLFMIPTMSETLRVNGVAQLVRDPDLLAKMVVGGKTPQFGLAVEVDEVYLQCGKALKRSELWEPATWPQRAELPSFARMLVDQAKLEGLTVNDLEGMIEHEYKSELY